MTKHYRIKLCLVEIDENNQMWEETGVLYSDYICESGSGNAIYEKLERKA